MLKCRMRRRECAITKKPYRSLKLSVGSKEVHGDDRLAMIGKERLRRRRLKYLATVRSELSKPSFCSSPWILGGPQSEFSAARRRMRVRNSGLTFGRPPCGRDRQLQCRRKPSRCQPTTVSGFTITRTSDHLGHRYRNAVQKKRWRLSWRRRRLQEQRLRDCGRRHGWRREMRGSKRVPLNGCSSQNVRPLGLLA